jgi:NitT/TauT family transport system ATP-binding protein
MIPTSPMRFECQHLCKAYPTRNGIVPALADVSFRVGEQEFVCIVGPSGCGKTTLLKLIAGLLEPTAGQVIFHAASADDRPRTALVFQEHGLFPWMTVLDNVAFGLEMSAVTGRGPSSRRWGWCTLPIAIHTSCRWGCANGWASPAPSCPMPQYC